MVSTATVSGVTRQTVVKGTGSASCSSSIEVGNGPNYNKINVSIQLEEKGNPNTHHHVLSDEDHLERRLELRLQEGTNQR